MFLIYIVFLLYIRAVILLIPVTNFAIKNGLVISCMIDITESIDRKKIRLVDTERLADAKGLEDVEVSANVKGKVYTKREANIKGEILADVEGEAPAVTKRKALIDMEKQKLANVKELVIISYKYQY